VLERGTDNCCCGGSLLFYDKGFIMDRRAGDSWAGGRISDAGFNPNNLNGNEEYILSLNAGYNWYTTRRDRSLLEQRRDVNVTTSLLLKMRGKGEDFMLIVVAL
jgi:hypothetical protein